MPKLTKVDLLSQLENVKNNYILGLASVSVLSESFAANHLRQSHCTFGAYVVDFQQVAELLESRPDREIALKEFTLMLMRGILKESFEVVRAYAEANQQYAKMQAQPWFHFFRLIRNCVSHNFHFEFTKSDKKQLPISWRGRTIEESLDDKPLEIAFLGYDGMWDLFSELVSFSNDQLT
jgi:hypothetical protein